jgi:hypothetical protein
MKVVCLLVVLALASWQTKSFRVRQPKSAARLLRWVQESSDANDLIPLTSGDRIKQDAVRAAKLAAGMCTSAWVAIQNGIENAAGAEVVPLGPKPANRPLAYSVEFTDPPCLQPRTKIGEEGVIRRFIEADVIIMGEHHYSQDDHELQAKLLSRMLDEAKSKGKTLSVGLEMVQRGNPQYQAALDAYVKSKEEGISEAEADAELEKGTEWATNWKWDFEVYKPVFHLARNKGIPLVALNVAADATKRVQEDGLDGLTDEDRGTYVPDPAGFVDSVKGDGFQRYTDKVILPMYNFYLTNNLLGKNPSPEKFFASRIFNDEAIATAAANYVARQQNGIMVVLAGVEKVKFGYGLRERAGRSLRRLREGAAAAAGDDASKVTSTVLSVLLNPSAQDSMSPTVQLQLVLAYGPFLKDQRPLADFLWFSKSPPVKILTRPKNAINNEGDKPPGESSIIGAF